MSSFAERLLNRKPDPPQIRKVTVTKKPALPASRPAQPPAPPSRSASSPSVPRPTTSQSRRTQPAPRPASRPALAQSKSLPAAAKHTLKRKSTSRPIFESDSEGDSDSLSGSATPQKRSRIETSTPLDPRRRIRDTENWALKSEKALSFIHSRDLCSGPYKNLYKHQFNTGDDAFVDVELRYPGAEKTETFRIVNLRNSKSEDYDPITDLTSTITSAVEHYLPPEIAQPLLGDTLQGTGIEYDLLQAVKFTDPDIFRKHLQRYNDAIIKHRADGTIARTMDAWPGADPALVRRIIDQIYTRTVSPKADKVGKIKNADKSNTYGELLPPFATQIFTETGLTSESVFLDLGSGVGNIVIQAALEVGCESYGIEMMPVSCELATAQAAELPARSRLWGLAVGAVQLWQGDFRQDPRMPALLRKVDVVLVNNEVFSAQLNADLKNMWLDLKEGAKIVSLKSFVPDSRNLNERNDNDIMSVFDVEAKEYWSSWVSWKDGGGDYYIATKDSKRVERARRRRLV